MCISIAEVVDPDLVVVEHVDVAPSDVAVVAPSDVAVVAPSDVAVVAPSDVAVVLQDAVVDMLVAVQGVGWTMSMYVG